MRIDQETLATMSDAFAYPATNRVVITAQLDRGAYARVNKVLEALGGKWNRKEKAHLFTGDAAALIDGVIDAGEVTTNSDMGHFPTPGDLALELCERARVARGMSCLEPSAGDGDIVLALAMDAVTITAIERDPTRRQNLRKLARTIGSTSNGKLTVLDLDDCMLQTPEHAGLFDRVVMNPPFLKCGAGDHLDHVRHAYGLLKPGGALVSVLPSSVTFRRDRRHVEFRAWYELIGGPAEKLPDDSFRTSGTGVSTVVVTLEKP